jgi:hypothetical protein
MGIEALLLSQVITIGGTTGQVVTKQADGSLALEDAAGGSGIGGSTGSTDNAALRSDGTGGATAQSSNLGIDDLYTASPNNVVNYVGVKAIGGTTNVGLALVPKGTGAFSLAVPDGTTAGGNARGANAIDLQTFRTNAANVASGPNSVVVGLDCRASGSNRSTAMGYACIASGVQSMAIGDFASATAQQALAIGGYATASGIYACAVGYAYASGTRSFAFGYDSYASAQDAVAFGTEVVADRRGQHSSATGRFSANGDAQRVAFILRNKTANTTPTTLMLDGSSARLIIPTGKVFSFVAQVAGIKSDGSAVAQYVRKGCIKRIANTTSLVGSIETIGTDHEDNASTDVAITADDTNEALQINVTGIAAETWRWVAVVEGVEIAYGV